MYIPITENSSLPTDSEIETEATETDQDSGDSVIDRYEYSVIYLLEIKKLRSR